MASARNAVVSPATCERPPARSTVAVLDRLPATPKPPKMPELTLPTPTASSSWLASTRASSVAYSRAALRPSASPTNATAAPARITWLQSDNGIPGSDGVGRPWGTSPTTRTPSAARSRALDATSPTSSVTNAHGTFGASFVPPNIRARETTPTTRVCGWMSSRPVARFWMRAMTSVVGGPGMPRMLGSSPMITRMVSPRTNPVTIGLERNSATQPMCSTLASISSRPAVIAMPAARATASAWLSGLKPAMREPVSRATVDTGPTINFREVPRIA